jgi:hypothetical protein
MQECKRNPPGFGQPNRGIFYVTMKKFPWEAAVWLTGLLALACYSPATDAHVCWCVFNRLGLEFCPGCGLGRSVAYALHGDIARSWQAHPLGIFALNVLSYRIVSLMLTFIKNYGQSN